MSNFGISPSKDFSLSLHSLHLVVVFVDVQKIKLYSHPYEESFSLFFFCTMRSYVLLGCWCTVHIHNNINKFISHDNLHNFVFWTRRNNGHASLVATDRRLAGSAKHRLFITIPICVQSISTDVCDLHYRNGEVNAGTKLLKDLKNFISLTTKYEYVDGLQYIIKSNIRRNNLCR